MKAKNVFEKFEIFFAGSVIMKKNKKYTSYKWLKYVIMDFFGLRDICEVSATIHRFSINDAEKCLYEIKEDMKKGLENVYVIKLIYWEKFYKLPNYLLKNYNDWESCREDLLTREKNQFSEIWYCKNKFNKDMAFGRILFCLDESFLRLGKIQTEIVWGASARLIDDYPNLYVPFVSLTKNGFANEWVVKDAIYDERNLNNLMQEVENITRKIPIYYPEIRSIGEWLRDCGCKWLSLEFSNNAQGKFDFIDWDTDNDLFALKRWLEIAGDEVNDEKTRAISTCKGF